MSGNKHVGSSLDSLFEELGELGEVRRMTEDKIREIDERMARMRPDKVEKARALVAEHVESAVLRCVEELAHFGITAEEALEGTGRSSVDFDSRLESAIGDRLR